MKNLDKRIEALEQRRSSLPWRKVTIWHPDEDIEALQREVLEDGEHSENFNWIIQKIVVPGRLHIWDKLNE